LPGSTTRTKTRSRDSIVYNALQYLDFDLIAAPGISQVNTVVQHNGFVLPCSMKIYAASVYQDSAAMVADGSSSYNVVAGIGTYVTATGARATAVGTAAGTIHTGDTITVTFTVPNSLLQAVGAVTIQTGILGQQPVANAQVIQFAYVVKATDTTAAILATSIVTAFNAGFATPLEDIVFAWNTGATGVVTFSALQAGTAANSIAITSAVTGVGATTTFAITATPFSGGTATTGVVRGVNDQYEYLGAYNFAPAGSTALSATPIFNSDMPIFNGGTTGVVNGTPGNNQQFPDNFDVIYQQGAVMTLRLVTPGANPPTNVKVILLACPIDVSVAQPSMNTFDPHLDIG
jgi:hypothetical protein